MKRWVHNAVIFLGLGAVVAATRVLDVRWRASHVRNASTSLKTLASCSYDFCNNDRDWNRVNDYWQPGTAESRAIKLIEISVAAADPPFPRPGSLEELVQGTRFWMDHWRRADCPHPATERFQGDCDAGLQVYWSKGLD